MALERPWRGIQLSQKGALQCRIRGRDLLETHFAKPFNPYSLSGSVGKVDDAAIDHWPAIVHPDNHALVVAEVRYPKPCSQRQRAMRAGERVRIEGFAGSGFPSLKTRSIPGGGASLEPVPDC